MIRHTSSFLDAGPGTTVDVGDAGMVTPSSIHGVILWASIDNVYWYVAENEDVYWTDDGGTSWSVWGDDYSGTILGPGAADGNTKHGFIVASDGNDEPQPAIIILYDPDDTGWLNKTGNLAADSAAHVGYRIYLLDV
jgi:hypothetical protein